MTEEYKDYPPPKFTEVPYRSPPAAANPVVRGLALYYGASLISSSSYIQNYLWGNAGFNRLRNRSELDSFDPRYDPTVIPLHTEPSDHSISLSTLSDPRAPAVEARGRFYTVLDYHNAYKNGETTPTAIIDSLLPIIRRDVENATTHSVAFLETQVELVRQAAEASTKRFKEGKPLGLLDGVPVAVKDEVDLAGYRKCLGTKNDCRSKDAGDVTSWCVEKWQEEGAVILGKLNMHEIGLDTTNNNPNYGTPLNPHNENYYTGGSSGGSGYVVGAGIVPIALGADGGGSIRIPSSFCGIYGLKTSHNRVSGRPSLSLANTTGVLGPMAGSMVDLEVAYRVMAARDPNNLRQSIFPAPVPRTPKSKPVLGIYKEWFDRAEKPVAKVCQKAIQYYKEKLGYEVIDISIPLIHEGQLAHALTILCEISSSFSEVKNLTPANTVLVKVGAQTPARDFLHAQQLRNLLMQHLSYLFKTHPGLIIVTPTTPIPGWHISGGKGDLKYGVSDGNLSIKNMEYVWFANFTGIPSLSLPVGYVEPVEGEGSIPVGLMGMGEWGTEDALILWGYDGEKYLNEAVEGGRRRPKAWVDVFNL